MAKKTYPSDKQDQFMLRMPDGMRDRIKVVAEANNRSMNAEIVDTLLHKYPVQLDQEAEELFDRAMKIAPDEVKRILENFTDRLISEGHFTIQDIEDGLIPGVVIHRATDDK